LRKRRAWDLALLLLLLAVDERRRSKVAPAGISGEEGAVEGAVEEDEDSTCSFEGYSLDVVGTRTRNSLRGPATLEDEEDMFACFGECSEELVAEKSVWQGGS